MFLSSHGVFHAWLWWAQTGALLKATGKVAAPFIAAALGGIGGFITMYNVFRFAGEPREVQATVNSYVASVVVGALVGVGATTSVFGASSTLSAGIIVGGGVLVCLVGSAFMRR